MKLAAVLGGAKGGFDELQQLTSFDAVFAVNDAAAEFSGRLAAFVTLHPEKLPRWLATRRELALPEPDEIVAHSEAQHVTRVANYLWPGMTSSGSSGLFATKVALERGFRVVLCGVPMDADRAHYFDLQRWNEVHSFRDAWNFAFPYMREHVRSMSGWTSELLGKPTPEWLAQACRT